MRGGTSEAVVGPPTGLRRVILLDGPNVCYRFGATLSSLTSPSGEPIGAVHGLLGTIVRFKKRFPSCRCVVVWDGEGYRQAGWRTKLFPGYKVRPRTGLGASLVGQIRLLSKILSLSGTIQVRVPEVEADDAIGVLVTECIKRSWIPVIYSSDRDFVQLMERGAVLITGSNKGDKLATEKKSSMLIRYGCRDLSQVVKIRAICGDASDRIPPAVFGVGVKTAAKLVTHGIDPSYMKFSQHSIDSQVLGKKLEIEWSKVRLNYRLMRITDSVDDPEFSEVQSLELKRAIEGVIETIENGSVGVARRDLLGMLASLGLAQAIQDRAVLLA